MLLIGWGSKNKPLGLTPPIECLQCGHKDHWAVIETKNRIRLYFVPVLQYGKKILIQCLICPNHEVISKETAAHLMEEAEGFGDTTIRTIAAVLKIAANVSGPHSPEWEKAQALLIEFSEGLMKPAKAQKLLLEVDQNDIRANTVEKDTAHFLLHQAVQITIADGHITDAEKQALYDIASRLGVDSSYVDIHISNLTGGIAGTINQEYLKACEILGVTPDTPTTEVRTRYKRLMKEHHPDRASPEQRSDATRKSAEINAAYDFIIGLSESGEEHSASKTADTAGTTKSKADTKPNKTLCENCERQVGQTSKFCGFCGKRQF